MGSWFMVQGQGCKGCAWTEAVPQGLPEEELERDLF